MLIDFANIGLKTKVSTSTICVDGYGVENLIDSKRETSFFNPKYFMAEYFVKCPVKVLLEFPFLINISCIVMNPHTSTHHTKVVEVHAMYQRPLKNNNEILPCSYGLDLSDFSQSSHYDMAGKYNERNFDSAPCQIIFVNTRHPIQYQPQNIQGQTITLKPLASLSCCSHLLLNITWATIPVIRSLQVWATVSQRNPLFLKNHINMLLNFNNNKRNQSSSSVPSVKKSSDLKKPTMPTVPSSKQIPEEFVDTITLSLMTIPLLLPSGNNIDQTTFDKFVANEQINGRLPSDPFTGIVFSESTKPLPNTALKLRIDEYLLKNQVNDQPRIYLLGGSEKNVLNKEKKTNKRKLSEEKPSTTVAVSEVTSNKQKTKKENPNHQIELEDSLNCALSETMSSLMPSCFTNPKKKSLALQCSKCSLGDKLQLYVLPCDHFLCQPCLNCPTTSKIDGNERCCGNCLKPFKRIEVKKYR